MLTKKSAPSCKTMGLNANYIATIIFFFFSLVVFCLGLFCLFGVFWSLRSMYCGMFILPYSSWQPFCFLSPTGGEGERLLCIVWQGMFVSWERRCLPTDYKKSLCRQDIQHTPCKLHFDVIKWYPQGNITLCVTNFALAYSRDWAHLGPESKEKAQDCRLPSAKPPGQVLDA